MPDPKLLEFTAQRFTADTLDIKVKNISSNALEDTLAIELYIPTYLVNSKVHDAAKAAATNTKPIGVASLAGVVTGPDNWSVWAKRETSDSSVVILLLNDLTQSGTELATPIKLAAGAEFIIGIPLNPQANRTAVTVLYSYLHGTDEQDQRGDGTLELKSDTSEPIPKVTLVTTHRTPTMIPPMTLVKIIWEIENGVSATLRGPLPGGNSELTLSSDPNADFKISQGSLEILVVSGMTFILQAEVKRTGKPNIEVVRMLSLDTSNNKYTYLSPRPARVLPFGLIEIDWAAWGVKQVQISVGVHTTRTITLTQQTLGRFYEGSGVMRVSATKEIDGVKTTSEGITLQAPPEQAKRDSVQVISWIRMKAQIDNAASALAVIAPKMAALIGQQLYIADVGNTDPSPPQEKLDFTLKDTPSGSTMWWALTAVGQRFVVLRLIMAGDNPDVVIAPYRVDGSRDEIPPVTLPPEIRPLAFGGRAVFDLVGFGERAYFVVDAVVWLGRIRRAYSVAFDSKSKKADLRPEPLLEPLFGYRLISFDDALYALNRDSGQMFRFDLTADGTLEPPKKAASAVKKVEGGQEQSMVKDGLLVPVGRLLVVLNPTSVPSIDSLEQFGLHNILKYSSASTISDSAPQDLIYNPQKDYWARCGHDLDVNPKAVAAFRDGESARLWIIQPDNVVHTLAVGSESLFAPDYVLEFPTKPLPPYLNKTRQFKITNNTGMQFGPMSEVLRDKGLADFSSEGPCELISPLPETFGSGKTEAFEFKYNEADPVPVHLLFQVKTAAGVKANYMLEVTFSGPDLCNATSVFKRVQKVFYEQTDLQEIPDTTQHHSTINPIVIPPPKRLIQGVKLRVQNSTTYQFWREAPEAMEQSDRQSRYSGDEITITYDTPAFFISAYGAGQLDINIDFSLPTGIEVSTGEKRQSKIVRINTGSSKGLLPEPLPIKDEFSYECVVHYIRKLVLENVYIGDGVATQRGEAIYLPVGNPNAPAIAQVLKINPEDLSVTPSADFIPIGPAPGAFAPPQSIGISNEFIFAMFGDTDIHVLDFSLQVQGKVSVGDVYGVVTGIKCAYESECFLLGVKKDKTTVQNISFHHLLSGKVIAKSSGPSKIVTGNGRQVSLDAVRGFRDRNKMAGFPAWVSSKTISPMALSTSIVSPWGERGRHVAVCIDGGLFLVGTSEGTIRALVLTAAGREEGIVFGRDGKSIYCLHSQIENQRLRVSRVDNQTWRQTHGLTLPLGEGVADLTTDTRQRQPGTAYTNSRSASMVITLDEKLLFVSHGRSIFKIDVAKMELRETIKVELPCRVFHVWSGKPTKDSDPVYGSPGACTLLYAIGASYTGNGFDGSRDYKTQLYKLAIPDE